MRRDAAWPQPTKPCKQHRMAGPTPTVHPWPAQGDGVQMAVQNYTTAPTKLGSVLMTGVWTNHQAVVGSCIVAGTHPSANQMTCCSRGCHTHALQLSRHLKAQALTKNPLSAGKGKLQQRDHHRHHRPQPRPAQGSRHQPTMQHNCLMMMSLNEHSTHWVRMESADNADTQHTIHIQTYTNSCTITHAVCTQVVPMLLSCTSGVQPNNNNMNYKVHGH